ncbi:unnamed protein product, partial [Rotaria sp. Silwood1]
MYSGLPKVNITRTVRGVAICLNKPATNIWKSSGSERKAVPKGDMIILMRDFNACVGKQEHLIISQM